MAQRKPTPLDAEALEAYGARLLRARALSVGELRDRLRRRAANAADIDPILAKFRTYGFLDDKRFAEAFATSRLESKGTGKSRILRDLRQRRVAPVVAQKTVDAVFSGVDEAALIEDFLARKFRGKDLPVYLADEKNLAAAFRKLRYSGFSAGNSIRILKKYSRRADELEETEEPPAEPGSDQDGGIA